MTPVNGARIRRGPRTALTSLKLGLLSAVSSLVLLVAVLGVVIPLATGSQTFAILTSSMEPAYPPGTLIVVRPQPAQALRVGDVITFEAQPGGPAIVTHRIHARQLNSNGDHTFLAMGDNNAVPDAEPVSEAQIKGAVWYALPWIGALATQRTSAFELLLPLLGALLLAWSVYLLGSWALSQHRRGTSRQPDER